MNWKAPQTLTDAGLIAAMALAGVLAQTCYITGMNKGDASFLSTIDYLRLPMTATADWLIFQEFKSLSVEAVFSALPKQIEDQIGDKPRTLATLYQVLRSGLRDHIPRSVWTRALNEFSGGAYSMSDVQDLATLAGLFTFRAMMLDTCEAPARYFWGCLHKMVYGRSVTGERAGFRAMYTIYRMIDERQKNAIYPGSTRGTRFASSANMPALCDWLNEEKAAMHQTLFDHS